MADLSCPNDGKPPSSTPEIEKDYLTSTAIASSSLPTSIKKAYQTHLDALVQAFTDIEPYSHADLQTWRKWRALTQRFHRGESIEAVSNDDDATHLVADKMQTLRVIDGQHHRLPTAAVVGLESQASGEEEWEKEDAERAEVTRQMLQFLNEKDQAAEKDRNADRPDVLQRASAEQMAGRKIATPRKGRVEDPATPKKRRTDVSVRHEQ